MNKYYELNKDLDTCTIIVSSLGYGKCFHEIKRLRKLYENKIKDLQKKAELGDHYKHLYSEVKKQKDDCIKYIHKELDRFDCEGSMSISMRISYFEEELLRMLGEIDDSN